MQPELVRNTNQTVDLNQVFCKIWRRKKFIIGFVLSVVIFVLGVASIQYLMTPSVKNYSESVRFNFPSSIQGTYPSGQRFSKNDLISTAVLKQVYDMNGLASQNIGFSDFAASFSVAPFAVNSEFIKKKYEQLLSNKKLSHTEVDALEKQYLSELQSAQANFAQISYIDNGHLGLSPELVSKVLNDIPRVWSEISIRDLGVLDLKIPGKQFYQSNLVEDYEYLQAVQYMLESSNRFQTILQTLQQDDLGGFVRDPKTGLVVSDLIARLQSIKQFDLNPIYAVIANLGLVKDKAKAELYLTNQIELIQDQLAELKQKTEVYKQAMQLYQAQGEKSKEMAAMGGANSGMVQYGDGFLSKIVGMVEQQKDTEYRQELLTKQIEFGIQQQELATEQEKLKRALKILKNTAHTNADLAKNYGMEIEKINHNLSDLVNAYQRILEVRNVQALGKSSALYELASDQILYTSDLKPKLKKVVTLAIVLGIVALMLAMFIALLVKEPSEQ